MTLPPGIVVNFKILRNENIPVHFGVIHPVHTKYFIGILSLCTKNHKGQQTNRKDRFSDSGQQFFDKGI
jgi:hypothetical protein